MDFGSYFLWLVRMFVYYYFFDKSFFFCGNFIFIFKVLRKALVEKFLNVGMCGCFLRFLLNFKKDNLVYLYVEI